MTRTEFFNDFEANSDGAYPTNRVITDMTGYVEWAERGTFNGEEVEVFYLLTDEQNEELNREINGEPGWIEPLIWEEVATAYVDEDGEREEFPPMHEYIVRASWNEKGGKRTAVITIKSDSPVEAEKIVFGISGEWTMEDGTVAQMSLPNDADVISGYELTTNEAASLTGLSRQRIIQFLNSGDYGKKVGRDWFLCQDDIKAIIARKGMVGKSLS